MSKAVSVDSIEWPAEEPLSAERVIEGNPAASTVVIHEDETHEVGVWRCSPGRFRAVRDGYSEAVHIFEGEGEIIGNDGVNFPLHPGAFIYLADGWSGEWVVREPLAKSYVIVYSR